MDKRHIRTSLLIGEERINKLISSSVLVVGVGGVGGYAVEILARSGVGNITLCDGDVVDITNINRQIIATTSTIGEYKTDAFKARLLDINPNLRIITLNYRYNENTRDTILANGYDYIIDAIDSVQDKVDLITESHRRGIPIISAMGAGNRLTPTDYEIDDIFKTTYDPLAKKLRKLLKDKGIVKHKVVYTRSESTPCSGGVIGSISYMPALAGIKLGAYVVGELTK